MRIIPAKETVSVYNEKVNFSGDKNFEKIAVVALLLALLFLPRIFLGMRSENLAEKAALRGDFTEAAAQYELAAERLFWRDDLWNDVGKYKLISGQRDAALLAYREAKANDRLSAFGWDILGKDAWEQGDHEKAVSIWQEGLLQHPDYYDFYARLAVAQREKGNLAAEQDAIRKWLSLAPDDAEKASFHYRLGLLLIINSPENALDELTLAARADDGFAPVVETLRTSLNLASLESDPAEKLILLGRGLGLVEEWQLAVDAFYNATQADPENASAWAWLGEAQQHVDQNPLPALNTALDLAPESVMVRSIRGLYWQRQNDLEKALSEFQTAAELESENPAWRSALGELYARSGDLPQALVAYQQATVLAPDDPLYWHLLARFSAEYGVDLEQVGLHAARKAVILSPDDGVFQDTLGLVYLSLGNDEKAEKQFLRALELDATLGVAHLHLGILHLKRGYPDLAYNSLRQAQELGGDSFISEEAARLLDEYFHE